MKLISVNIEAHKHLDTVIPFLVSQNPDVVCLQEIFEADLPQFEAALGMTTDFEPMTDVPPGSGNYHIPHELGYLGVAILTKHPVTARGQGLYARISDEHDVPIFHQNNNPNNINRMVLWNSLAVDRETFTIATTHFTWSAKGSFDELQQRDLTALLAVLEKLPEFVLCGDFNSPRNLPEPNAFKVLAEKYTDNIPAEYLTSIDGAVHKGGKLTLMVDGLFTTPEYKVTTARLQDGVSDHLAIVAEITKVTN